MNYKPRRQLIAGLMLGSFALGLSTTCSSQRLEVHYGDRREVFHSRPAQGYVANDGSYVEWNAKGDLKVRFNSDHRQVVSSVRTKSSSNRPEYIRRYHDPAADELRRQNSRLTQENRELKAENAALYSMHGHARSRALVAESAVREGRRQQVAWKTRYYAEVEDKVQRYATATTADRAVIPTTYTMESPREERLTRGQSLQEASCSYSFGSRQTPTVRTTSGYVVVRPPQYRQEYGRQGVTTVVRSYTIVVR